MNKTKMILAATGGVIGLAILVMAYFTWSAFSAKTAALEGDDEEGTEGLETVLAKAQSLSRKSVYPCAAALAAVESNRAVIVDWQKEAVKLAARGDRPVAQTTAAQFKTDIVADAKRLLALPGAVDGALAKPEFAFGPFKAYIAEGKMPAESELADLQRRWDDVSTVVEILAKCGIAELTDVQFKAATAEQDEAAKDPKKNKKRAVKNKKAASASQQEQKSQPVSHAYVVSFLTKPSAFVKALNAFVVCERFVTVEDFSFSRARDTLAEALGGEEKQGASAQSSGRRGRRGRRAEAEAAAAEEKDAKKGGIVTDPLLDAPLAVTMTVNVRDFRSLEEEKNEEKGATK